MPTWVLGASVSTRCCSAGLRVPPEPEGPDRERSVLGGRGAFGKTVLCGGVLKTSKACSLPSALLLRREEKLKPKVSSG